VEEATAVYNGSEPAAAAAETARRVFEQGGVGGDLPAVEIPRTALEQGQTLVQLLHQSGLASSLGEARRLIRGGGARVNDQLASEEDRVVTLADLNAEGVVKLSAGRKRHALVRPA
jgi:tyrosyl-tRNA synthetase